MPISHVLSADQLPSRIPVLCPVRLRAGGYGVLASRSGSLSPCAVLAGGGLQYASEDDLLLDVRDPQEISKSLGHAVPDTLPVLAEMLGRALIGTPKSPGPQVRPHFVDSGSLMPLVRYYHGLEFWVLQFLGYGWCFHHEPGVRILDPFDSDKAIHVPALAEVETSVQPDVRSAAVVITLAKPWETSP